MSAPVQLALVELAGVDACADHWRALLAPDERQRAASLPPALQPQWIGARAVLRMLLAERLGRAPASLRFGRAGGGKPFLVDGDGLFFNLAHAGGLVACALADQPGIGVDVEFYERRLPASAHWGRFLDPVEYDQVGGCPRRFIRHWVHKEAVMKATGAGIRLAPRTIRLRDAGAGELQLASVAGAAGHWRWRTAGGEAGDGRYAWAVARRLPPSTPLQVTVTHYAAPGRDGGGLLHPRNF